MSSHVSHFPFCVSCISTFTRHTSSRPLHLRLYLRIISSLFSDSKPHPQQSKPMHLRNAQNPKLTTSSTILLSLILLPSIAVRVLAQPNGLWSDSGGSSSSSGSFLQDYINCLNQSGYTSFSNALVQANHTESGQKWLAKIVPQVQSNGGAVGAPWTVFAPNDEACTFIFSLLK